jgi:hypothetical protein
MGLLRGQHLLALGDFEEEATALVLSLWLQLRKVNFFAV